MKKNLMTGGGGGFVILQHVLILDRQVSPVVASGGKEEPQG